ncbi:hypothetical protein ACFUJU_00230 [Streptomyces sp. NPDC057235]|uniref:hypothetical protein n=1 Tax=unclassified Streptomyces TaxID=2593676 RepID=UPI00362E78B9
MLDSTSETTDTAADGRRKPSQLAELKAGLLPEKRALAEDLRSLFGALGLSVRGYALRRHLDASSVTRYLNGERVPQWKFVAELIGDVREAAAPLTPEAEKALRDTHRAALRTNRRGSEIQNLQDRLASVDEETRRIKARERALEEALFDREKTLSESITRCHRLETRLDSQRSAHTADLALWKGEWEQLQDECGHLHQEVLFLQEALAVTRAELIAAEGECHRLETELETMAGLETRAGGVSSLMAALEAADRTATVSELLTVIGDLEARTQKAMARELVSSVSRSRRVEDVAALLTGLQRAGLHAHAEAALPALVMTRPVAETAAMAAELHRAGLEDYVATLLRSSIELHTPCDVIGLALLLRRGRLEEVTQTLLSAAFVVRTVTDVVAMTVWAAGTDAEPSTLAALGPAAAHRSSQEVVELSIALRNAGRDKHVESLRAAAAERRSAKDVVNVIECFMAKDMDTEADHVFALSQNRDVPHVLALARAMVQAGHSDRVASIVDHAVRHRPVDDVAAMIIDLYNTEHFPQAAQVLMSAVRRSAATAPCLFSALDKWYPGAEAVVHMVAASGSPENAAFLMACLESAGLHPLAEAVFRTTLMQRPTGHAGVFLQWLASSGTAAGREEALRERARAAHGPDTASLLLALVAARLSPAVDAVVQGAVTDAAAADVVMLIKQLRAVDHPTDPRAEEVIGRIAATVVDAWTTHKQVSLVITLSEIGLAHDAEFFTRRASERPNFKKNLKSEQTKHAQRVFSPKFWRKRPEDVEHEGGPVRAMRS